MMFQVEGDAEQAALLLQKSLRGRAVQVQSLLFTDWFQICDQLCVSVENLFVLQLRVTKGRARKADLIQVAET